MDAENYSAAHRNGQRSLYSLLPGSLAGFKTVAAEPIFLYHRQADARKLRSPCGASFEPPPGSGDRPVMQVSLLNQAFHSLGIASEAPENHGILCGLLCARGEVDQDDWLALMFADAHAGPGVAPGSAVIRPAFGLASGSMPIRQERALLSSLYEETVRELRDGENIFTPLLPDDGEPLGYRAEAVSEWCRGFVYGLGAGGIDDHTLLPDDIREIASDIIEISRASSETDEGEEDEAAYMEIVEYLRAGVTLVYETLEAGRRGGIDQYTLH
jgi:uncharacterized protein